MGSRNRSWKGTQREVRRAWERVFDARATSEAEWYSLLFVLLRRVAAFLLRRMGWNVSGTKKTLTRMTPAQMRRT